jgi:hypothetical protein
MNRKKKLEVLFYWIIRILSLIILSIAFYLWLKNMKSANCGCQNDLF